MSIIKLPRLISDGVIFQRNKKILAWGWTDSEDNCIEAELNGIRNKATLSNDGEIRFDITFDAMPAGGPYELKFYLNGKEEVSVKDVMIGDVLLLSGQSNIEFPMSRVLESYPEELISPDNSMIRTFKVIENRVFDKPVKDNTTGSWVNVTKDSLPDYSAIGYFAAKKIYEKEQIAVGLINTTLGGATIECWMGRDMFADDPETLKEWELYNNSEYLENILKKNEETDKEWYGLLNKTDEGLLQKWYLTDTDTSDWKEITLPCYLREYKELEKFNGSMWLKKKFVANKDMCDSECSLWFGTIIDADVIYVNGEEVGRTEYCYPPRRYQIRKGLLKEGENEITLNLKVEKFGGRITKGKVYGIFTGNVKRDTDGFNESVIGAQNFTALDGEWKYKIGTLMPRREDVVFASWKPSALYNGMLAPCTNMNIKAVVWYQGESNAKAWEKYYNQFNNLVEGYRKDWRDSSLPFIFLQLPEYMDAAGSPETGDKYVIDWVDMMEVQKKCLEIHDTYMVETLGTGEYNDLHPQRKKGVGEKIADVVIKL